MPGPDNQGNLFPDPKKVTHYQKGVPGSGRVPKGAMTPPRYEAIQGVAGQIQNPMDRIAGQIQTLGNRAEAAPPPPAPTVPPQTAAAQKVSAARPGRAPRPIPLADPMATAQVSDSLPRLPGASNLSSATGKGMTPRGGFPQPGGGEYALGTPDAVKLAQPVQGKTITPRPRATTYDLAPYAAPAPTPTPTPVPTAAAVDPMAEALASYSRTPYTPPHPGGSSAALADYAGLAPPPPPTPVPTPVPTPTPTPAVPVDPTAEAFNRYARTAAQPRVGVTPTEGLRAYAGIAPPPPPTVPPPPPYSPTPGGASAAFGGYAPSNIPRGPIGTPATGSGGAFASYAAGSPYVPPPRPSPGGASAAFGEYSPGLPPSRVPGTPATGSGGAFASYAAGEPYTPPTPRPTPASPSTRAFADYAGGSRPGGATAAFGEYAPSSARPAPSGDAGRAFAEYAASGPRHSPAASAAFSEYAGLPPAGAAAPPAAAARNGMFPTFRKGFSGVKNAAQTPISVAGLGRGAKGVVGKVGGAAAKLAVPLAAVETAHAFSGDIADSLASTYRSAVEGRMISVPSTEGHYQDRSIPGTFGMVPYDRMIENLAGNPRDRDRQIAKQATTSRADLRESLGLPPLEADILKAEAAKAKTVAGQVELREKARKDGDGSADLAKKWEAAKADYDAANPASAGPGGPYKGEPGYDPLRPDGSVKGTGYGDAGPEYRTGVMGAGGTAPSFSQGGPTLTPDASWMTPHGLPRNVMRIDRTGQPSQFIDMRDAAGPAAADRGGYPNPGGNPYAGMIAQQLAQLNDRTSRQGLYGGLKPRRRAEAVQGMLQTAAQFETAYANRDAQIAANYVTPEERAAKVSNLLSQGEMYKGEAAKATRSPSDELDKVGNDVSRQFNFLASQSEYTNYPPDKLLSLAKQMVEEHKAAQQYNALPPAAKRQAASNKRMAEAQRNEYHFGREAQPVWWQWPFR